MKLLKSNNAIDQLFIVGLTFTIAGAMIGWSSGILFNFHPAAGGVFGAGLGWVISTIWHLNADE